jgi:Zn-dependent protease with chaperone function
MANYLKTAVLLAALTALLVFIGISLVGPEEMWLALAFAFSINAYAYWQGPGLVLAARGAVELDRGAAPHLIDLVRDLARFACIAKQADNLIMLQYPATAPLHIVDPLPDRWWASMFATHPPVERRILRLNQMRSAVCARSTY